jgi:hypothetical protein
MPNVTQYLETRNDAEWQEQVHTLLEKTNCKFVFHKANGEIRHMECTLMPQAIPEVTTPRAPNPNIITVFDTQISQWRTINWDRIIGFKVLSPLDS